MVHVDGESVVYRVVDTLPNGLVRIVPVVRYGRMIDPNLLRSANKQGLA